MTPMSRASSRRDLLGLATMNVRSGPMAASTPMVIGRITRTPAEYQPGQRYHPRYSPPSTRASRQALAPKCQPNALSRNFMNLPSLTHDVVDADYLTETAQHVKGTASNWVGSFVEAVTNLS